MNYEFIVTCLMSVINLDHTKQNCCNKSMNQFWSLKSKLIYCSWHLSVKRFLKIILQNNFILLIYIYLFIYLFICNLLLTAVSIISAHLD